MGAILNGPWIFNNFTDPDDYTLKPNPNSWHQVANLMYVDQPSGIGFSTVDGLGYSTSGEVIGAQFYSFLLGFVDKYPQFKDRPLYFAGESFAGHYIPDITAYIVRHDGQDEGINLQGATIGNGFVDPYTQQLSNLDFLLIN